MCIERRATGRKRGRAKLNWRGIVKAQGFECLPVMLQELYRNRTLDQVAAILGVSSYAIREKMVELGIRRRPRQSWVGSGPRGVEAGAKDPKTGRGHPEKLTAETNGMMEQVVRRLKKKEYVPAGEDKLGIFLQNGRTRVYLDHVGIFVFRRPHSKAPWKRESGHPFSSIPWEHL
jgi:hypothetical protein